MALDGIALPHRTSILIHLTLPFLTGEAGFVSVTTRRFGKTWEGHGENEGNRGNRGDQSTVTYRIHAFKNGSTPYPSTHPITYKCPPLCATPTIESAHP